MNAISKFLHQLKGLIREELGKDKRLEELEKDLELSRFGSSEADPVFGASTLEGVARLRKERSDCQNAMYQVVERFLRAPPWHERHWPKLPAFFKNGDFERSVFVMTKFPEGDSELDKKLKNLIDLVCRGLTERGLIPRLATGARFHDWLWDEVELHLLGCERGIAIVEDRYYPELNPNVAMEWGWMRAMGRHVLFLQEKGFAHGRADLGGLRAWKFDWDDPEPGVLTALDEGLVNR